MNSILETLPQLGTYHMALTALGILILVILIQAILTAPLALAKGEQSPGMPLKGDHTDFSFRVLRTHYNSVENFSVFLAALLLAILAGANATWINWLAIAHVIFRLTYWAIYYNGRGKIAGGSRSFAFIGGWLTNMIIAGMGLYALIF